ncbi:MAG: cytochrome c [Sphingomonadaceae bacterium]|nr:cytochrome c [Sphingomonadaceae bacterium]
MTRVALLLAAAVLTAAALPSARRPAPARTALAADPFAPRARAITLPDDTTLYPDGPGVDAMNGYCAACHSPAMVLTQPKLTRDEWAAEVAKMRSVYKAPIADEDVPAILDYLAALKPGA